MMSEITQLLCPHNRDLFVGAAHGVVHYEHEDGNPCDMLNSFVKQAADSLGEMALLEGIGDTTKPETPLMRAAFLCSLPLRVAYYRKLAKLQDALLFEQFLQRLVNFLEGAHNLSTIAWELEKVFGPVVWINLGNMAGSQQLHMQALTPEKPYALPKRMPMINMKNSRKDSDWAEIEEEVNQKMPKKRQSY